jgi:hypothetical protein
MVLERSGPKKMTKFRDTGWVIPCPMHAPDHREKDGRERYQRATAVVRRYPEVRRYSVLPVDIGIAGQRARVVANQ